MFVLYDNEESRVVTEQLDAATQCTLRVNGETVGIKKHNRFEADVVAPSLEVGLGEKLELFANKFDALPVRTINKHDVRLDFWFLMIVNQIDEIVNNGPFPSTVGTMEEQIRNAIRSEKSL